MGRGTGGCWAGAKRGQQYPTSTHTSQETLQGTCESFSSAQHEEGIRRGETQLEKEHQSVPLHPSRKTMNQSIFSPNSCLHPIMKQTAADEGCVIKRLLPQILLTLSCRSPQHWLSQRC